MIPDSQQSSKAHNSINSQSDLTQRVGECEMSKSILQNRTNTYPTSDNNNDNCYSGATESTLHLTDNRQFRGEDESDRPCDRKPQSFRYLKTAGISEFFAKSGHSDFYKCYVDGNDLTLRKTQINYDLGLEGSDRSHTRSWSLATITNGYEYLDDYCLNNDGGAFFGCADGSADFPMKAYQKFSTQIICEIDDIPRNEQIVKYKWFQDVSSLIPYLISSGGKSVHNHLLLNEPTPINDVVYLRRLLCLALDGDPAVTRPHQPFRLPTFFRREKGNFQEILQESENYTYDEILNGLKLVFSELGYQFPLVINEDWWQHLERILKSDKHNKGRNAQPISKEEKLNNLKNALAHGQDGFYGDRKKTQKERIAKAQQYKAVTNNLTNSEKEQFILELISTISPRVQGSGTYEDYRSIACAIKNELGESTAIAIMNQHSPGGGNWDQIISSSNGSFSLGSIIYYAKEWGNWQPLKTDPIHGKVILSGEDAIELAEYKNVAESVSSLIKKAISYGHKFKELIASRTARKVLEENYRTFVYNPELPNNIPHRKDFTEDVKIIVPRNITTPQLIRFVLNAFSKGWNYQQLALACGFGKSELTAKLQCLIIDKNYNNPSIDEIREKPAIIPRIGIGMFKNKENGLIAIDPEFAEGLTQEQLYQPNPFWAEHWELVQGQNCIRKELFTKLRDKNYEIEGTENPICKGCQWSEEIEVNGKKTTLCKSQGYKHQRHDAIAQISMAREGRLFPTQTTEDLFEDRSGSFNFSQMIAAYEEAGRITEWVKTITVKKDYLNNFYRVVVKHLEECELKQDLLTLIDKLILISDPQKTYQELARQLGHNPHKFYGLSSSQLTEYLGKDLLLRINQELTQYGIDSQLTTIQTIVNLYQIENNIDLSFLKSRDDLTNLERINAIEVNWVEDFLHGLADANYSFTVSTKGQFEINKPDQHLALLASQFERNLFLDATESPISLKRKYGINEPMLIVENEPLDLSNITVLNIHIDGLKSKDISNKASAKVLTILSQLEGLSNGDSFRITHQVNKDLFKTEYYFGNHDRGSNVFKNAKLISFIGTPYTNLGAVAKEYDLFHYDDRDKFTLEEFFEQKAIENEIQGIMGRPRGHHRPNEKIVCAVFGTNRNLDHLKKFNMNVVDIDGNFFDADLLPQELKLLLAVNECIEKKEQIKQSTIADKLEVKQGAVSKIFNKLSSNPYIAKVASFISGGWKHANNLFQYLIDNLKGDGINFEVEKLKDEYLNLINWIHSELDKVQAILRSAFGLNDEPPDKIPESPPDEFKFNPTPSSSDYIGKTFRNVLNTSRKGILTAMFEFKNRFYAHIQWVDTNELEEYCNFSKLELCEVV